MTPDTTEKPSQERRRVSKLTKAGEWATLIVKRPSEALDRFVTVLDVIRDKKFVQPPAYEVSGLETVLSEIIALGTEETMESLDAELGLIETSVTEHIEHLRSTSPIKAEHNGDFTLARLCYAAVRVSKPEVIIETGVASGVTSTFILSALEKNKKGKLFSIDLPPLGPDVDQYVGCLVPGDLRDRWELKRGTSRKLLPALLKSVGTVDLFVHDSLHTLRNISFELDAVTPFLSPTAVVISDDIDENPAFMNWTDKTKPSYHAAVQEEGKRSLFGTAIMQRVNGHA